MLRQCLCLATNVEPWRSPLWSRHFDDAHGGLGKIGLEPTMLIAFALEGVAMAAWYLTRENALLFVVLSGIACFGWGEIFSLFPSTLTDTFGPKYASTDDGAPAPPTSSLPR